MTLEPLVVWLWF